MVDLRIKGPVTSFWCEPFSGMNFQFRRPKTNFSGKKAKRRKKILPRHLPGGGVLKFGFGRDVPP